MAENKKKNSTSINRDLSKLEQKWKEDKEFAELLLDTVREGLLVLDTDLRVDLANESFYHFFNVEKEETEGTLLYDLGNGQWNIQELRTLLEEIIPEEKVVNDYEIEHEFENIGRRVMLLNARRIDHLQLILLAIEDVTDRNNALRELKKVNHTLEEKVEERTREVRKLVARLSESEQEERQRISRILHDELQQILFAAQMNIKMSYREVDPDKQEKLADNMEESIEMLNTAIEKTRELTGDLNPFVLKSEQLTDMMEWITGRFDEMHGLQTKLNIKDDILIPNEKVRAMLLQIVRELLFNIVKHAGTDRAVIRADNSADDHLVIEVIDEGGGFDAKEDSPVENTKGFGLFNIRERLNLFGGNMQIDSAPGKGSHMTIRIQLQAK
ncbi:MAG: ATP-binding protein [Balneolaceae bacterium]